MWRHKAITNSRFCQITLELFEKQFNLIKWTNWIDLSNNWTMNKIVNVIYPKSRTISKDWIDSATKPDWMKNWTKKKTIFFVRRQMSDGMAHEITTWHCHDGWSVKRNALTYIYTHLNASNTRVFGQITFIFCFGNRRYPNFQEMGRKIPTRKHMGVRDPLKQSQERYAL